jgi:oligoendopeptidase F
LLFPLVARIASLTLSPFENAMTSGKSRSKSSPTQRKSAAGSSRTSAAARGAAAKGGATQRNLPRHEVPVGDTWDLASLFASDDEWEHLFAKFQRKIRGFEKYRGRLSESAKTLSACLKFDAEVDRIAERLGAYAYLRTAEDQANSPYQRMLGRFQTAATQAGQLASFIRPELLAIPAERMDELLAAPELKLHRLQLERMLRYRPYTLSDKEEQLLAMQGEMAQTAARTFRQLHDADLKFGLVKDERGRRIELTNATFSKLLHSPDRAVRKTAFHQYYEQFAAHENTLASLLFGSVQNDVYYARVRGHSSALDQALFADNVPRGVYDGLIEAVHRNLPALYRYYDLRRRKMKLRDIHHYDTYVPILSEIQWHRPWDEAVEMILEALEPLGQRVRAGLRQGPAREVVRSVSEPGKQSGAFSYGTYDGDPFILMNYKAGAGRPLHAGPRSGPLDAQLLLGPANSRSSTTTTPSSSPKWPVPSTNSCWPSTCGARPRRPTASLPDQPGTRCRPGDDLPPDDVRRVRKAHPRAGGRRASR